MSTGTPTPWRIWNANDGSVNIVGPDNEYVALVGRAEMGSDLRDVVRADARTIVQAVNAASEVGR